MSSLRIEIGGDTTTFAIDEHEDFVAPVGDGSLTDDILHSDPPRPEELTNAIGVTVDHLDDLLRERPGVIGAPASLAGRVAREIAAVELGHDPTLPLTLSRDAVEDVFRTLATESRTDRALNPGLRAEMVRTVVAGCCVAVAIMRRLHLDEIEVVA
jgi:exopolyphosphatase/guanosine-5'-triphosphate,3'-diphosphate pyrophosphatase